MAQETVMSSLTKLKGFQQLQNRYANTTRPEWWLKCAPVHIWLGVSQQHSNGLLVFDTSVRYHSNMIQSSCMGMKILTYTLAD